jgi:hypothetical protein
VKRTELCDRFGIDYPLFAFIPWDNVAAISRAGGLGVLGCVRFNAVPSARSVHRAWPKIAPSMEPILAKVLRLGQGLRFERDANTGTPFSRGEQGPAVTAEPVGTQYDPHRSLQVPAEEAGAVSPRRLASACWS